MRPAPPVDNSCAFGAGVLTTTAEDLVRFGSAFLGGRLVSAATIDDALTSMKTSRGEETGYGIGWEVGVDSSGRRFAALFNFFRDRQQPLPGITPNTFLQLFLFFSQLEVHLRLPCNRCDQQV